MKKSKKIDPTGKVTVTKSEERYPYSSEILMNHGFCIIFLNMALGLLPVTIWGTRMKYFKCSISQVYTTLFCLCFFILSLIFVPVCFFPRADEPKSMTNLVILLTLGMLHTIGYIALLIRGHFVARCIPVVWNKLSKLLQIAVLDVYGVKCHLLKEIRSFAIWALFEYSFIMATTMGSVVAFSLDYTDGIDESIGFYKLDLFVWPMGLKDTPLKVVQWWSFRLGYFIWQLCSSCHVLVTMFLCYMVVIITISLKSVNQQIQSFKEKVSPSTSAQVTTLPSIKFTSWWGGSQLEKEAEILERLETIKNVMLIVEEITITISKIWGMSLIVEALILIGSGTVNAYEFFAMFRQHKEDTKGDSDIIKFSMPEIDEWLGVFVTISNHFFFLFRLACKVNLMIEEANKSLHLLKQISCHHLSPAIGDKVKGLKQDLATTSISITASNFFQVNKFLLTSITSQITTYVIVLLQFAQQDINNHKDDD